MPPETTTQLPLWESLPWAALDWLGVVAAIALVGLVLGWLAAALQHGPVAAVRATLRALADAGRDLLLISPERVAALAWLTVKESIRRRVIVVFALFIVVLLLAGWFLDPASPDPARLYISFVLMTTLYLVILLMLLLSSLSLPNEIKNRTLHTVITKPVRHSEIVLGRVLGFVVVGTALLMVMGPISLGFVYRGLKHVHEIEPADLQALERAINPRPGDDVPNKQLALRTTLVHGHRHRFYIDPVTRAAGAGKAVSEFPREGTIRTETEQGHWHELSYRLKEGAGEGGGPKLVYEMGREQKLLVARVPLFGTLRFKDRAGQDTKKGINVGDEWDYRSFIQGGTLAAAIWTFQGITESEFSEGLPVEMTIEASRSHKGDIEKTVRGSLSVRNPETGRTAEGVCIFASKKYVADAHFIPRQLEDSKGNKLDLFRDFVANGKIEIWLKCIDPQQYFGAAEPDLYLRADDAPFWMNFAKAYFGIWLQMVLVVAFGVMFSTRLSGPIAMLATGAAVLGGMFVQFVKNLAYHQVIGGGPMEQGIRTAKQHNLTLELPPDLSTTVAQMGDWVLERVVLRPVAAVLPDFGRLTFPDDQGRLAVASGFDIRPDVLLQGALVVLGFVVPLCVMGYFFLKTREVAE